MARCAQFMRWVRLLFITLLFPFQVIKWLADFALTLVALGVVGLLAALYFHMIPDATVRAFLNSLGQRLLPLVMDTHGHSLH